MIRKYQIGATVNYISSVNPNKVPQSADQSTTSSKKKSDDELVNKSLLDEFYTKGIPVDVDVIAGAIGRLQNKQNRGIPVSATELNQLKAKINRVVKASEYFEQAKKNAKENDALGEIAVTDRGELFVFDQDINKIKKITKNEFNIEEHGAALTVSELIRYRENLPQMAFDTITVSAVGNSVGMSVISDRIKTILDIVGTSTSTSEAYTDLASYIGASNAKRPTQMELNTLQIMATAIQNGNLNQETLFKISQKVGSKNVEAALNYISRVLPRNMQEQLQGRLVAQGYSVDDARKEMGNIVFSAIQANNTITDEFNVSIAPEYAQSTAATGSSKTFYQTVNEQIFDPQMNDEKINLRSRLSENGNPDIQLTVEGNWFESPLTENKTNTPVTKAPLSIAVDKTITQYVDKNHMYAGTQKISAAAMEKMLYNGDGQGSAWMPINSNGDINWKSYQGCEKAEKVIEERGYVNDEDKNKVHSEYGSFCRYVNGELKVIPGVQTAKYFITYAYALDDEINEDVNTMVEQVTGQQEDYIKDLYDRVFNDDVQKKTGFENPRSWWDDIYKVPIFIKVNESAPFDVYRYNGHGSLLSAQTLEDDKRQQERQRRIQHPVVNGNANIAYSEQ